MSAIAIVQSLCPAARIAARSIFAPWASRDGATFRGCHDIASDPHASPVDRAGRTDGPELDDVHCKGDHK
jgi:hypothetical protein